MIGSTARRSTCPGSASPRPRTTAISARRAMRASSSRCSSKADRGPVHLFGNSLGGAVATLVAARRPDLVRTLTLVSPAMPDLRPRRHTLPMALMWLPVSVRPPSATSSGCRRTADGGHPRALLRRPYLRSGTSPNRGDRGDPAAQRPAVRGDAALASFRGLVSAYVTPATRSPWSAARQITVPDLGAVRPRRPAGRMASVPARGAYVSRVRASSSCRAAGTSPRWSGPI